MERIGASSVQAELYGFLRYLINFCYLLIFTLFTALQAEKYFVLPTVLKVLIRR